jgi:biopolymer transport protein ExbD
VIIQADAKTPHEAVVRVMDAARRLGLTHLTFATQQPAGARAP